MAHRTTSHTHVEAEDTRPPDIVQMRATTARALAHVAEVEDLDLLASTLRGHMHVMVPEVEALAARRHDTAGISARACVGEARRKLQIGPGDVPAVRVSVVQKLARSVDSLCRHYEQLGGSR